jgi:hypothetical protein
VQAFLESLPADDQVAIVFVGAISPRRFEQGIASRDPAAQNVVLDLLGESDNLCRLPGIIVIPLLGVCASWPTCWSEISMTAL